MLSPDDLTAIQLMIDSAVLASQQQHQHLGFDSQILSGSSLQYAPQPKITSTASSVAGNLSTGGAAVLSTADSTILTNLITNTNISLAVQASIIAVLKKLGFTY